MKPRRRTSSSEASLTFMRDTSCRRRSRGCAGRPAGAPFSSQHQPLRCAVTILSSDHCSGRCGSSSMHAAPRRTYSWRPSSIVGRRWLVTMDPATERTIHMRTGLIGPTLWQPTAMSSGRRAAPVTATDVRARVASCTEVPRPTVAPPVPVSPPCHAATSLRRRSPVEPAEPLPRSPGDPTSWRGGR